MKVIVTGLPRCGTSFLTGLIAKMGYSLGSRDTIKQGDEHNKYGYFEHMLLMNLSNSILGKLGGDFMMNIPAIQPGWSDVMTEEKSMIRKYVDDEGIELYKDNRLVLLSEIYDEIYPDAKWIYIKRDIVETFKSRFGQKISMSQWEEITEKRVSGWRCSNVSKQALVVDYADFHDNFESTVSNIMEYLGAHDVDMVELRSWFRPSTT